MDSEGRLYPILAWLSACIFCLWNYPAIRGVDMLNLFYAYYLSISVANLIYMLSKAKNRFSFSQVGLYVGFCGRYPWNDYSFNERCN